MHGYSQCESLLQHGGVCDVVGSVHLPPISLAKTSGFRQKACYIIALRLGCYRSGSRLQLACGVAAAGQLRPRGESAACESTRA